MGILSSLNTGVTGLSSTGIALGVISDNIANANTYGFKTSRAEFSDVIARSLKGVLGGNQIGRGTKLDTIKQIFNQGSIIQTDRTTDIAISGDGFFVMDGPQGRSYTRAGAFNFNKDAELVNADGVRVMGFRADEGDEITTKLDSIKLERTVIDAKKTEKINVSMNLDIRDNVIEGGFNLEDPDKTSNYSTGATVFDSAGNTHTLTVYFTKTGDNQWNWNAVAKGEEIAGGQEDIPVLGASGTLTFTADGKLQSQQEGGSSFSFAKGALPDQQIKFDFGDDLETGGTGVKGSTQYGTESDVFSHTQDGYTAGTVSGLSFSDDGILAAFYSNGITKKIAQVAVARFENNEGLFKSGSNMLRETKESGLPNIGKPSHGGRGHVFAKSLETSATDIATEFINLIQMQRAFQANARTLTTSDELMQEIMNMRRG